MLFLYLLANLVGAALIGHTKKHSERFGCDSHIGQLNAPTSALALSLICIQHSYVNHGPCFFSSSFFFLLTNVSLHMCLCALFLCAHSLCIFPLLPPTPPTSSYSPPSPPLHSALLRQTKRDAGNFGFVLSFI